MNGAENAAKLEKERGILEKTSGYRRIFSLFDDGTFNEIDSFLRSGDGYAEAAAGYGTVDGCPACAFSQNGSLSGGAMSKAQASKIKKVFRMALKAGVPVVGIYDSIGARLDEGADMLASFGEVLLDANSLSGVVPQISVVLGPCTGTAAMVAAGADIVVMSPKGELTVATDGADGSCEEAEKLGLCHIAARDENEALRTARELIAMLPSNNIAGTPLFDAVSAGSGKKEGFGPQGTIASVCDAGSFHELGEKFGSGAVTGLARVGGTVAGITSLFGVIDADSCSKAARFVRFCDSFSIPVVTLVDAEKFATLREASKLSSAYSEATTPKITVVTGRACGPVYIAAVGRGANADYTFAWPQAVVSPVAPATAAVFLWSDRLKGSADPVGDRRKLIEEYETTEAGAFQAAAGGLIEDIVAPDRTRRKIIACLGMLSGKRVATLPKKHADIQL